MPQQRERVPASALTPRPTRAGGAGPGGRTRVPGSAMGGPGGRTAADYDLEAGTADVQRGAVDIMTPAGMRVAAPIAGEVMGTLFGGPGSPLTGRIGGGLGGAVGEYVAQQMEGRPQTNWGSVGVNAAMGAVPTAARSWVGTAARSGVAAALGNLGLELTEQGLPAVLDDLPGVTARTGLATATGSVLGGAAHAGLARAGVPMGEERGLLDRIFGTGPGPGGGSRPSVYRSRAAEAMERQAATPVPPPPDPPTTPRYREPYPTRGAEYVPSVLTPEAEAAEEIGRMFNRHGNPVGRPADQTPLPPSTLASEDGDYVLRPVRGGAPGEYEYVPREPLPPLGGADPAGEAFAQSRAQQPIMPGFDGPPAGPPPAGAGPGAGPGAGTGAGAGAGAPGAPGAPGASDNLDDLLRTLGVGDDAAEGVTALDPHTSRVNASGESAASMEALSRQRGMADRGEQFVVYRPTGERVPLTGPDAVDYTVRPGESYGIEGPEGFRLLDGPPVRPRVTVPMGESPVAAPAGPPPPPDRPQVTVPMAEAPREVEDLVAMLRPRWEETAATTGMDMSESAGDLFTRLSAFGRTPATRRKLMGAERKVAQQMAEAGRLAPEEVVPTGSGSPRPPTRPVDPDATFPFEDTPAVAPLSGAEAGAGAGAGAGALPPHTPLADLAARNAPVAEDARAAQQFLEAMRPHFPGDALDDLAEGLSRAVANRDYNAVDFRGLLAPLLKLQKSKVGRQMGLTPDAADAVARLRQYRQRSGALPDSEFDEPLAQYLGESGEAGFVDPNLLIDAGAGALGAVGGSAIGAATSDEDTRVRNALGYGVLGGLAGVGASRGVRGGRAAWDEFGQALERSRYFSMLSGLGAQTANLVGGAGATHVRALEELLQGNVRQGGRILREVWAPETVRRGLTAFRENLPDDAAAETGTRWGRTEGALGVPSRFLHSVDQAYTDALQRAGLSSDEARDVLFTNQPHSRTAQGLQEAQRGPLMRAVVPFFKTAANLVERGLEHTPGVGYLPAVRDMRGATMGQASARQFMGLLAGGAGAAGLLPEDTPENRTTRRMVEAALGPLLLPAQAAEAAAGRLRKGDDPGRSVAGSLVDTIREQAPMATDAYDYDPARFLGSFVPGALTTFQPEPARNFVTNETLFDPALARIPGGQTLLTRRPPRRSRSGRERVPRERMR